MEKKQKGFFRPCKETKNIGKSNYNKKHKTKFFFYALIFFILLINKQALKAATPELVLFNISRITPEVKEEELYSKPVIFPQTNNLRRKKASPFLAKGELLVIKGQVTDLLDVPIENVVVRIWQTNHFGYYNYMTNEEDEEKHDIDFTSAGVSVTNNLGFYSFTTVMPGYYDDRAPHISFEITHPSFSKLETKMIFPYHSRNETDPKIQSMNPRDVALITCFLQNINEQNPGVGKVAVFNIKLNGIHPTKQY